MYGAHVHGKDPYNTRVVTIQYTHSHPVFMAIANLTSSMYKIMWRNVVLKHQALCFYINAIFCSTQHSLQNNNAHTSIRKQNKSTNGSPAIKTYNNEWDSITRHDSAIEFVP